ncbi:carboxymuconolactone decarboxylase family protein [Albirhodobacter sp. R86504]|jgi:4-carboxymuconolactone decarboxylase|uniref:carboxymuconolactone decarboxylase family protein n=1 Tax=Albirhodobacter sp. R86504 TaxID=3093848 RepID=UPI0036704D0F
MSQDYSKLFAAMIAQSQEMARAFQPALESFNASGVDKLFPTMPKDMLEMFFGKTFNRDGLDARTRFLVTVAGMVAVGAQGEPQLRVAIRNAIEAGATPSEIAETIFQMSMFGGVPAMTRALEIAQSIFDETKASKSGTETPGENT